LFKYLFEGLGVQDAVGPALQLTMVCLGELVLDLLGQGAEKLIKERLRLPHCFDVGVQTQFLILGNDCSPRVSAVAMMIRSAGSL
jgi:hypothetical protein